MQNLKTNSFEYANDDERGSDQQTLRWLPSPHSASDLARMDAALLAGTERSRRMKTRIVVSMLAIGAALTLPDLSLGAVDASQFLPQSGEPDAQAGNAPAAASQALTFGTRAAPLDSGLATLPDAIDFSTAPLASDSRERGAVPLVVLQDTGQLFETAFADIGPLAPVALSLPVEAPQSTLQNDMSPQSPASIAVVSRPVVSASRSDFEMTFDVAPIEPPPLAPVAPAVVRPVDQPVNGQGPRTISTTPREPVRQSSRLAVALPSSQSSGAGQGVESVLAQKARLDARINGVLTGSVDFRQLDGTIAIRLGSVVDLLRNRFSQAEFDALVGAGGLDNYLTLADFQSAGIPIDYDPVYDEVTFGIDYNDAPNAHKVQVDQIGVQQVGNSLTSMEQLTQPIVP